MRTAIFNPSFVTALLALVLAAGCSSISRVTPADLALRGGRVFTGDPATPWASALAVSGEDIVAVGTDEEIRRYIGPATRSIALTGRVVVPGINDSLVRLQWEPPGVALEIPPDASVEVLLSLIRDAVARAPEGSWIRGELPASLFEAILGRTHLDIAAPLRPVRLDLGANAALLNSSALLEWGIAEGDEDPSGGRYGRTVTGALDGWVFGSPLRAAAHRAAEKISDEVILGAIRDLEQRAVRLGVTSVQVVSSIPSEMLEPLLSEFAPAIRWRVIESALHDGGEHAERASRVVLDGSPVDRGSALSRPYADEPGETGVLALTREEIATIVRDAAHGTEQLLVQASGDAAVASLLIAMADVDDADWPARRLRLEQNDLMSEEQTEAVAGLGIVVVQSPSHFPDSRIAEARFGAERRGGVGRLRSLLGSDVSLALGSGGSVDPWRNVMLAAMHPANSQEALTREEAVAAHTRGSAFAEFEEARKGTIGPGMAADFTVLSQDVFTVALEALSKTRSELTVVGGEIVWEEGGEGE
ncbi:MAG: amidohydrolase [Thermoanaerobaculia bacterium]